MTSACAPLSAALAGDNERFESVLGGQEGASKLAEERIRKMERSGKTNDPDGYVMAVDGQVICEDGTNRPAQLSYKEFTYWQKRIQAMTNRKAKVAVLFGRHLMDRQTHRLTEEGL